MTLSGNYDRKVKTMMNSALNWIDDDGIVTALEDMADDSDYEELFDE